MDSSLNKEFIMARDSAMAPKQETKDIELEGLPSWTKQERLNSKQIEVEELPPRTHTASTCSCSCDNLPKSRSPSPVKQNPLPESKPIPIQTLTMDLSYFGVKHLGLAGIKRIFNPYANKCIRFVWSIIYILVLAACTYQISERINFYLKSSIGVRVTNVANRTLKLPSVTVCAADPTQRHPAVSPSRLFDSYGNISYTNAYDLLTQTNMSVADLWNLTRINIKNMTFGLVEGISLIDGYRRSDGQIRVALIDTTGGRCLMFNANEDIEHHGFHTFLHLRGDVPDSEEPNASLYQVYVHPEEDIGMVRFFAALRGVFVSFHKNVFLTVKFKEVIYKNQRKKNCQSEVIVANCLQTCIERRIYKALKRPCSLPYMNKLHVRPCTTPEEFRTVYEVTNTILEQYEFASCSCPRKCKRAVHTVNLEIERDSEFFMDLEVYFPDNTVERVEEYEAYTLVAMFSDIGGNLGLFLGMSLLSMGEILEVIVTRIFGNPRTMIE